MGDTGSLTLGYTLSFLAIKYSQHNADIMPYTEGAFIIAFSTMIIPAFDVVRVVLVRIREGHSPFEPDKNHIHHKFLALGCSHRKAMFTILALASLFIILNMALCLYININVLIMLDVVLWTALHVWLTSKIKKKREELARLEQQLVEAGCRNCKERDVVKVKFFLEKKAGKIITIADIKEKSGVSISVHS